MGQASMRKWSRRAEKVLKCGGRDCALKLRSKWREYKKYKKIIEIFYLNSTTRKLEQDMIMMPFEEFLKSKTHAFELSSDMALAT